MDSTVLGDQIFKEGRVLHNNFLPFILLTLAGISAESSWTAEAQEMQQQQSSLPEKGRKTCSNMEQSGMFIPKKIKKSKMLITAVLWYRVLSCSQLPAKVSSFHLYVVFPSLKGYLFFKYFVLCRGCSWNPLHSTYAFYKNAESLECFCFCCSWCDKAEEKHSEQALYEQVIEMSTASCVEYVLRLSIWVWQSIHKLQHCFYWGNPTLKLFS